MAVVTPAIRQQRNLILVGLLVIAASAWAILIWQAGMMDDEDMGLTMGMSAPLFIAVWVAMMVAIMFPTAAPMVIAFSRVQAGRRQRQEGFIPTWLFVLSYIALWSATAIVAYSAALLGDRLAEESMWVMDNAARIGGVVIVLAGLYQLSPLKTLCLTTCRTPAGFLLSHWKDGTAGALRMGLEHGAYCFGCCWLLFALLFPLGMMNIAVLAGVTVLIFAEKSLAIGRKVAQVAAVALVLYGLLVIIMPEALPTMM
jgi:predicted metal-binding membrane protein